MSMIVYKVKSRKNIRFEALIPIEEYNDFEEFCETMFLNKREYFEMRMKQILKENNLLKGE